MDKVLIRRCHPDVIPQPLSARYNLIPKKSPKKIPPKKQDNKSDGVHTQVDDILALCPNHVDQLH